MAGERLIHPTPSIIVVLCILTVGSVYLFYPRLSNPGNITFMRDTLDLVQSKFAEIRDLTHTLEKLNYNPAKTSTQSDGGITDLNAINTSQIITGDLNSEISGSGQSHDSTQDGNENWKTIVFWHTWFGKKNWHFRFGTTNALELRFSGCPSWRCTFTYNQSISSTADAVVFSAYKFGPRNLPVGPRPWYQRWVWVHGEAQANGISSSRVNNIHKNHLDHLLNWTMTFHRGADVSGAYGYFLSLGEQERPLRPNFMSSHGKAMKKYVMALKKGRTLEDIMGPPWYEFVKRPLPVAWMSSHCPTTSRREQYVRELQKYITVETYGNCGTKKCLPKGAHQPQCWENLISKNYSFYLSFENNLCEDYITEKLYIPLTFNLVPVVWGGSNYDEFMPPHSYINARHYHPKDLAKLLTHLHNNPVEYGRYHLWRGYFQAFVRGPSFCEMCHLLHTSTKPSHYTSIREAFIGKKKCDGTPTKLFEDPNNPDAWKKLINETMRSTDAFQP